ncbi:hypothetical protein QMA04_14690 [Planococcus sp. APC 3900]|uniref:hypothetical protein n=1 Tax=Planococcus sp. APC 3900 TaxID=3035191 RepID=UPI0025B62291|nr:hypothetical protein [Planococcus sp. APC 3900]MDN3439336.1 hypothetical protein [Planococcus sp. APC 3900]
MNRKKPGALVPGFFGLPKAIANFFGSHYSSCSIRNFGTTMENPYERLPIPANGQKASKYPLMERGETIIEAARPFA